MVYTKKVGFKTKLGYSKGRAGRTYTKKKTALTKVEKTQVARIAKQVFTKNVEHKYRVMAVDEISPSYMSIYAFNPIGSIIAGTSSEQRVGEVINNVRLRVKLSYVHKGTKIDLPANLRQWPKSQLRVMVIRTKSRLTASDAAFVDLTNSLGRSNTSLTRDTCLFYQPTGWVAPFHAAMQDVRKDNGYRVIYDKVISSEITHGYSKIIDGDFIPHGKHANAIFSLNLGKIEYNESNASYVRDGLENCYVLIVPYTPRTFAGTDIAGDVVCHYSLAWTDS